MAQATRSPPSATSDSSVRYEGQAPYSSCTRLVPSFGQLPLELVRCSGTAAVVFKWAVPKIALIDALQVLLCVLLAMRQVINCGAVDRCLLVRSKRPEQYTRKLYESCQAA